MINIIDAVKKVKTKAMDKFREAKQERASNKMTKKYGWRSKCGVCLQWFSASHHVGAFLYNGTDFYLYKCDCGIYYALNLSVAPLPLTMKDLHIENKMAYCLDCKEAGEPHNVDNKSICHACHQTNIVQVL